MNITLELKCETDRTAEIFRQLSGASVRIDSATWDFERYWRFDGTFDVCDLRLDMAVKLRPSPTPEHQTADATPAAQGSDPAVRCSSSTPETGTR